MIIMPFSSKDIRGTNYTDKLRHLNLKNPTYQKYYLYNYDILTSTEHDYKKCSTLDYNLRIMRFKINLTNLGKMAKKIFNFPLF